MISDLRFAFRQLVKSPGFTFVAVLTLAIGIGANTAIFSVINSALLRPLPFPDSERIVQIWEHGRAGTDMYPTGLSFKHWRDENTQFDGLSIVDPVYRTLTGSRSPERIKGILVSASYLHMLRVQPQLGRDFSPDADRVGGANNVVILSHEMWQTRFGGAEDIIDRTIILDQLPHTVVGVLAPNSLPRNDALFLLPVVLEREAWRLNPRIPWTTVTGRLKAGVTLVEAKAELTAIKKAHANEFPPELRGLGVSVVTLREQLTGTGRSTMLMLLVAGGLVLLIACANVANLLLARATSRTKEMAVRSALGASVRRIVCQVLTENIVLAVLGGALGVLVALFTVDLLGGATRAVDPGIAGGSGPGLNMRLTGGELPFMLQPKVDWAVLTFAFGTAVLTGILCGLFPAVRACRSDVNRDLNSIGRGATAGARSGVQSMLVTLEVAMTVLLLIGAGLFLRSFANILSVDPGFNPREVVYFDLAFPRVVYPENRDVIRFEKEVVRRLSEQAGITAVGAVTNVPFGPGMWGGGIGLSEQADRSLDVPSGADYVQGDFFRAAGIPLRRGRGITEDDNQPNAPRVLVINEALARSLFAEQDPIGRRVVTGGSEWEVVGIVGEIRTRSLEGGPRPFFYGAFAFNPGQASVVVRSSLPPRTLHEVITTAVRSLDPDQPVLIRTLTAGIEQSLRGRQSMLWLVNVFAAVALLLACLGIYGVMAYTIGQRRRELGIRMALGASQPNVISFVMRDGLRLATFGLVGGLIAALAGARLIATMLFGVSAHDPAVFIAVGVALAAFSALSCWVPARRAARVDLIRALRAD
jgi:putative ABC transport system permease protein